MNEQQPSQRSQEPLAAASSSGGWDSLMVGQSAPGRPLRDRRHRAWFGGILAGMAIAIALALVMHVIQQVSPNGSYISVTGSVVVVLFLGVIIGLGLGMGLAAAVPDTTEDSAAARHGTPIDRPSAQPSAPSP